MHFPAPWQTITLITTWNLNRFGETGVGKNQYADFQVGQSLGVDGLLANTLENAMKI